MDDDPTFPATNFEAFHIALNAMASSLAAQLSQIARTSTHSLNLKAQKAAHSQSLLFDPTTAATQDISTIYALCIEGFQELCLLDRRFVSFGKSIFSEQSKAKERTQMTKAENEELSIVLEDFLGLVGAKLLLKPAIKALEWLVRRFRSEDFHSLRARISKLVMSFTY